jgi:hypothetical protein
MRQRKVYDCYDSRPQLSQKLSEPCEISHRLSGLIVELERVDIGAPRSRGKSESFYE